MFSASSRAGITTEISGTLRRGGLAEPAGPSPSCDPSRPCIVRDDLKQVPGTGPQGPAPGTVQKALPPLRDVQARLRHLEAGANLVQVVAARGLQLLLRLRALALRGRDVDLGRLLRGVGEHRD